MAVTLAPPALGEPRSGGVGAIQEPDTLRELKWRKRHASRAASAKLRNGTVLTDGPGLLQIAALSWTNSAGVRRQTVSKP